MIEGYLQFFNISRREFANLFDINYRTLAKYLANDREIPFLLKLILLISKKYKISVLELYKLGEKCK